MKGSYENDIEQLAIATDRITQIKLWSLTRIPTENILKILHLNDNEIELKNDYKKKFSSFTDEEKARNVIEITSTPITGSDTEKKFKKWYSLYSQSPREASDLLEMWAAEYNAYKVVWHNFVLCTGSEELSDQKIERWRSLYRQSPDQAMDFLKIIVKETISSQVADSIKSSMPPEETEEESEAAERPEELPLDIPCPKCGSKASILDYNDEGTAGKYICFFCNKTTFYRKYQNAAKRRREAIPESTRLSIMARAGYCCEHCGSDQHLHIDHIVPFSKGGSNDIKNLQLLCRDCNLRKGGY